MKSPHAASNKYSCIFFQSQQGNFVNSRLLGYGQPHRKVFEEEVAPVVLDIEEEAKDKAEVHQADEDDHHHPTVYRHPHSLAFLLEIT